MAETDEGFDGDIALLRVEIDELGAQVEEATDSELRMPTPDSSAESVDEPELLPFDVRWDPDGEEWMMYTAANSTARNRLVFLDNEAIAPGAGFGSTWVAVGTGTRYLNVYPPDEDAGIRRWYWEVDVRDSSAAISVPLFRTTGDVETFHHGTILIYDRITERSLLSLGPSSGTTPATDYWDNELDPTHRPALFVLTRLHWDTSTHRLLAFGRTLTFGNGRTIESISAETVATVFTAVEEMPHEQW